MDRRPLFRPAAVEAQRPRALGEIVLTRRLSFALLTAVAVGIAAMLIAFFIWGTYTKHSTLNGQLVPHGGVIKVRSPQYGMIVEKHVREGQIVGRGELLYVVSSDVLSSTLTETQRLIGIELERRRESLEAQVEKTRLLERSDAESLRRMLAALGSEMSSLRAMIDTQRERIELAKDAAARYERIQALGFVSREQLRARQQDVVEQRSRLQSLEREHSNVARQLAELESQLASSPLRYQNQLSELERALAATRQERTENEARRRVAIVAPATGLATAVAGDVGHGVDSSKPLVSIVPEGARLYAELYAPSRAVGFIESGDSVLLRYPAYPYQKFGHQRGTVSAVSRTALAAAELAPTTAGDMRAAEPVYRVNVDLDSQHVIAYGRPHALQAGMRVEADVLQETRRLYEWILEPLYTLAGKLH